MRKYCNYHIHSDECNVFFSDSPVKKTDYAKRAVELGHTILSSCEHGFAGNFLNTYLIAEKYNLKFVFAAELYWVKDNSTDDKTNNHIVLIAKNEAGFRQINRLISDSNDTGFYYRPRLSFSSLLSLNPNDVMLTTACIAFYGYGVPEAERQILRLHQHFGDNMYIEVQAHPMDEQKVVNQLALKLYRTHGIKLIAGVDSHFIFPEQADERKSIQYGIDNEKDEDAQGVLYMDYPDGDELFKRFKHQGVLPEAIIEEAISNTNVVETFSDFMFDKTRKIPNPFPELTQEERNQKYLDLVDSKWQEFKKGVDPKNYPAYEEAIRYETDTIVGGGIADYFLLDYAIVQEGIKRGGVITRSGRGSGPSMFVNTLLGFSTMDRLSLPVKMFPDRFVSKPRLIAGQLPDLDLNVADRTPFIEAQKAILGDEHCYPMIAYGTLKKKAAWKMYCRAVNKEHEGTIDNDTMQIISNALGAYDMAVKEAEDEDDVDINDYVDEKYIHLYEQSEKYGGIISGKTVHPCAVLVYSGNIREEIGLIRAQSKSGKKNELVTVIDGVTADKFGYVKNDILRVACWELIDAIYKQIGMPIPTTNELLKLVTDDKATWDVFAKGYCNGVNQCEKPKTKERLMRYKPQNFSELSAFVAAIRPGFKSNLETFISRQHFDYGIPAFDNIIQTQQMHSSFLLYQENIMAALGQAGFESTETYLVLKHIAKKHPEEIAKIKPRFMEGFNKATHSDSATEMVWKVISDASSYSFNACLAGSERIYRDKSKTSFYPTIEEMYRIKNDADYANGSGHKSLREKYQREGYGYALSMFDDERLRQNKIVDIRFAGVRSVFKVTLEDGKTIRCTDNHKFPTPNGDKMLRDLVVGDELYVKDKYEKNVIIHRFTTDETRVSNLPTKGQRGFQTNHNGQSRIYHRFRQRCVNAKMPCCNCGAAYDNKLRFEVHHVDHDSTNNTEDNYTWLCVSCHKKTHYSEGRKKRYEKGIPVNLVKIASIVEDGIEDTYDVEMAAPANNFVVDSGIITHNSHSAAVAFDALYVAWAKAHHPVETFYAMLKTYDDGKKKDKLADIKSEMWIGYHIKLNPVQFGGNHSDFTIDVDSNSIGDSLTGIPYVSRAVATRLAECPIKSTKSWIDFLVWNAENSAIDARQTDILIDIGYFREFGNAENLKILYKEFREGKFRYAASQKDATKEKRIVELHNLESQLGFKEDTPYEIASRQTMMLGYPLGVFDVDPNNYVVVGVEEKYSPKISLFSLARGTTGVMKMKKDWYKDNPLFVGDCVRIGRTQWEQRPKYTFVDGQRKIIPGSKENWLIGFDKILSVKKEKSA